MMQPDEKVVRFEIHPAAKDKIDQIANLVANSISIIAEGEVERGSFKSDRPIAAHIDAQELIEQPILRRVSSDGVKEIIFIIENKICYGLRGENVDLMQKIVDNVLKNRWASNSLSQSYLDMKIISWLRDNWSVGPVESLPNYLIRNAERDVEEFEVWIPIAFVETSSIIDFEAFSIGPITPSFIDSLEALGKSSAPNQISDIEGLFAEIRKKMQGLAAVICKIHAEPKYVSNRGWDIANEVVGILRFFAPSASSPWISTVVNLLGSEQVDLSHVISLGKTERFSYTTSLLSDNAHYWQLSASEIDRLYRAGLPSAMALISKDDLTDFDRKMKSAILVYSKGITFSDLSDRVIYSFSALESLFLKDGNEPITQNVAERIALFIGEHAADRKNCVRVIKKAYGVRSQYVHHRVLSDEKVDMELFMNLSHFAIQKASSNRNSYKTKSDFLDALDDLKFSG